MGSALSYFSHEQQNETYNKLKKGFGWIPDIPDHNDKFMKWGFMLHTEEKVDLRDSTHMPYVYDQGQLGSCTAHAIAAAYAFDEKDQNFDPSRLFIYYNERDIEGTIDQDSGATIRDGIKTLNKIGVCPESDWPYDISKFKDKPDTKSFADASKHKIIEYRRINITLPEVKNALSMGYPVIFGMTVYESFMNIGSDGIMHIPGYFEKIMGGHAILVVGYDSNHLIVRNSWGTEWGDSGYFYMPQEMFKPRYCSDAWIIYSNTDSENEKTQKID